MASTLISGPAGAGKTAAARELLAERTAPTVLIDFQQIYAGLLGIERLPNGRYPERLEADAYALALAEYTRRAMITGAQEMEIEIIATNSDGSPARREYLRGLLGAGAVEQVLAPGKAAVVERLSINGVLSEQCGQAIDRWYGRLPNG